ncbi:permease [Agaricicola taiwanensis]|uniref:Permease n=1 Tax=Agaricicola taiwanensis TaxID=591372 RepID=A0A8J2VN91_9RHOB|nr:MFS transporter [Agaricicola taiwanensis]GGE33396.1 permease [Agaricicola taiwanensis]
MQGKGGETAERRNVLSDFLQRRTLVMLALGFSAGLPNLLIFDTLSAWLRGEGISLAVIGFFSLATLAYSAKFLWAPLVDRTRVPLITGWLGHRRSWMLLAQAAVILGLWAISGSDPASQLGFVATAAVFVGFAGATQDIVIDAWRIEAADDSQQGILAAAYQWGYRVAIITAGAAPLVLAQAYSWNISYAVMAALMGIGVLAVLVAPREREHAVRPIPAADLPARPFAEAAEWLVRGLLFITGALIAGAGLMGDPTPLTLMTGLAGSADAFGLAPLWKGQSYSIALQIGAVALGLAIIAMGCCAIPGHRTRPGVYLGGSFGAPLADFFRRYEGSAALILALICIYRVSDFVLNIMNPFYLDLGFTMVEIAEVRKIFGVFASLGGVILGGYAIARFGLMRSLLVGAFAGAISNLAFVFLATSGHSLPALYVAIGVDNVCGGFSGTCLIAYMSSLTSSGFTATQYALFSSLYALPGKLLASQSGRIVEGAARGAESGGPVAPLMALFTGTTPESYAAGAAKLAVSPAALGVGYVTFFLYSALIGVFAVVLTVMVMIRPTRGAAPAPEEVPAR